MSTLAIEKPNIFNISFNTDQLGENIGAIMRKVKNQCGELLSTTESAIEATRNIIKVSESILKILRVTPKKVAAVLELTDEFLNSSQNLLMQARKLGIEIWEATKILNRAKEALGKN